MLFSITVRIRVRVRIGVMVSVSVRDRVCVPVTVNSTFRQAFLRVGLSPPIMRLTFSIIHKIVNTYYKWGEGWKIQKNVPRSGTKIIKCYKIAKKLVNLAGVIKRFTAIYAGILLHNPVVPD